MRQVADLRARALDDLLVGADERVELGLQRLDLGGQVALELLERARADAGQAALDLAQRQQPEPHLEQRHGDEAEAGERQRRRQVGSGNWRRDDRASPAGRRR